MRSTRWLAASLSLSLWACGPETQETQPAPRSGELQEALSALPGTEVAGVHDDGVPFLIRGPLGETGRAIPGASAWQAHALLAPALERIAPAFRLKARDLVPLSASQDEQGHTHLRYSQTKHGLPVAGEQLILHLDSQGRVYAVNGSARDGENVSPEPRISAAAARQAALGATRGGATTAGEPRLVYVRAPATGLLTLAFQVEVEGDDAGTPVREQVFVGALDGAEVRRYSEVYLAKNRRVCSVGGTNNGLCRTEGQAPTSDPVINAAYDNLGRFYDCFSANYARDSYNNAGALLSARVHYQSNFSNAYWDGTGLVCGDGDGVSTGPLCSDPDIVIHELTHAVTDSESGLIYANESGALNESLSDIFAAVCQSWAGAWTVSSQTWWIGEQVWTPSTAGDALRYMDNPTLDGSSRDYYPERYTGTSDNGGVHWNSGIVNLAFKLLSTGGTHPRGRTTVVVPSIGVQAAGRIFYRASTDYFTASTTMAQAKTYTRQAAQVLGYSTAIQDAVDRAWEAVGVGTATPPPTCTLLTNGVTLSGLAGAAGSQRYFCLDVPANLETSFSMSGGTGDADMYVKFGSAPTTASYDCRPYLTGNNESCKLTRTTAGRYWVMLRAYSAYSGVSLLGKY